MSADLISIDAKLDEILRLLRANQPPAVASDKELDDPRFGDPVVKFNPRDWSGELFVGSHFSQCPPLYLDMLADAFDYFAGKNDESGAKDTKGNPKSKWDRLSAAKARGWARRIRGGWKPPKGGFDDDARDLGF